jgi:acyl-CoA thioester hydrolase
MGEPMLWRLKVRHYEVDVYGHVNHANYVHYFETARIEALDTVGLSLAEMRRQGYLIFATDLSIKYRSPAQTGETLEIVTHIREIRGARSLWVQEIREAGSQRVVATAEVTGAFMTETGRPVRAPQSFIEKLSALCISAAPVPSPSPESDTETSGWRRWCLCRGRGLSGALRRMVA